MLFFILLVNGNLCDRFPLLAVIFPLMARFFEMFGKTMFPAGLLEYFTKTTWDAIDVRLKSLQVYIYMYELVTYSYCLINNVLI